MWMYGEDFMGKIVLNILVFWVMFLFLCNENCNHSSLHNNIVPFSPFLFECA